VFIGPGSSRLFPNRRIPVSLVAHRDVVGRSRRAPERCGSADLAFRSVARAHLPPTADWPALPSRSFAGGERSGPVFHLESVLSGVLEAAAAHTYSVEPHRPQVPQSGQLAFANEVDELIPSDRIQLGLEPPNQRVLDFPAPGGLPNRHRFMSRAGPRRAMDQALVNHPDQPRNREEAPVLEVPKRIAYQKKSDPQLLTVSHDWPDRAVFAEPGQVPLMRHTGRCGMRAICAAG